MTHIPSANDSVKIAGYRMPLPRSRLLRIAFGIVLIVGGVFSFLPILGVWMLPLGLVVLSVDIPRVRRWRRRSDVWFHRRFPKLAAKFSRGRTPSPVANGDGHSTPPERPLQTDPLSR